MSFSILKLNRNSKMMITWKTKKKNLKLVLISRILITVHTSFFVPYIEIARTNYLFK